MEAAHGHIANNNFGTEEEECYLSPQEQNKLLRMAIRGRWKLTPKQQEAALKATVANVESDDPRVSTKAVQNLIAMNGQNQRLVEMAIGQQPIQHEHHVSGGIVLTAVREEILNDPQVLEALRNHQGDSDAGTVCAIGGPAVEVPETPEVPGPSHNGHTNGNGRH